MRVKIYIYRRFIFLLLLTLQSGFGMAQVFGFYMPEGTFSDRKSLIKVKNQVANWFQQNEHEVVAKIMEESKLQYASKNLEVRFDYLLTAATALSHSGAPPALSFQVIDSASTLGVANVCRQKRLILAKANVLSVITFNKYEQSKSLYVDAHQMATSDGCYYEAVDALLSWANSLEAPRFRYPQELRLKLQALKEARKYGLDSDLISEILGSIGITHYMNRNYDLAMQFWQQQLQIHEILDPNNKAKVYLTYNNMGLAKFQLGEYSTSKKLFKAGLNQVNLTQDSAWIALLTGNLAKVYFAEKQVDSAYAMAEINYHLALRFDLITSAFHARNLQAEMMIYEQKWALAEKLLTDVKDNYLGKTQDLDRQESGLRAKSQHAELLSKVESHKGNYKQAYLFLKEHHAWRDSLTKMDRQSEISQLQAQFDFDQKESENVVLRTLNQAGLLRIKYQSRIIVSIAVAALFFLGIIMLLVWFYRRQRSFNQQLEESNSIIVQYLDELKLANHKLQDANQLKEKLITIIGHDLRQPLIGLHNLITLVENHKESALVRERSLPMASYKLSETMNLMDNLIVWAKQHAGGWSPRFEVLALKDMVTEAFALAAPIAAQKQIDLENTIPEHVQIKTDRNVLLIVLRNLVSNSLKFTISGGAISVSCEVQDVDLHLTVCDTGTGMDNEIVSQLFKQSGMTMPGTLKERGHGLGLMLCKDFIEKLNGNISVESELGKGTSFFIVLPNVVAKTIEQSRMNIDRHSQSKSWN